MRTTTSLTVSRSWWRLMATAATAAALVAAGVPAANAAGTTVESDTRVMTRQVVAKGGQYTLDLSSVLPAQATAVVLQLGTNYSTKATAIAVCPGAQVTAECLASPAMTAPANAVGYARVSLGMAGAGRKVSFSTAMSDVAITARVVRYTAADVSVSTQPATPQAIFDISPAGLAVAFDASASAAGEGTITGYRWAFGDGTTGSGAKVVHTYGASGTHVASLTVTNSAGASAVFAQSVSVVAPNAAPVAAFTATASELTGTFDASGSSDADGRIARYSWNFGDGSVATGMTALHTYTQSGTFTTTLTVTDDRGGAASASKSLPVLAPNKPPTAAIAANVAGLTVMADGAGSQDADGKLVAYRWTFGDGSTAATAAASHTYAKAGTYTVTLSVTDDRGGVATTSTSVTICSSSVYPDGSNTGVPAGVGLSVHEGDLKVTTANTVIDAMEIRGTVWVQAPGVVIKNSLISGRTYTSDLALVMVQGAGSVTIQDSELYAKYPSVHIRGIIGQNFTLLRSDVHDVIDQMVITGDNVLVKDSWLHSNLYYLQDPNYNNTPTHDDNAQISIGTNLSFVHNTMESTHNAAIMVTQDRGKVSRLTLKDNLISNGACAVNLAEKSYGPMSGFVFTDNVFTRTQKYSGCAIKVPTTTSSLISSSGNSWADGKPVAYTK